MADILGSISLIAKTLQLTLSVALLVTACLVQCSGSVIHGPKDYCLVDIFQPSCGKNEVVMIETAMYGRMKPGKCFPADQGNFGCSVNVMPILDSLCSGRQTCKVRAAYEELAITQPCPGAISYLSVSYSCKPVKNPHEVCRRSERITDSSGYLMSPENGQSPCPVSIDASSGQLIKFTIYNFLKKTGSACYEVAVIKEKSNQKSVHVCQSDPRTKEVMMTSSSHVAVHFSDFQIGELFGRFLLQYEATGCPHPTISVNTHIERNGDTAKVICNNSDSSWFIYCKNNKWTESTRKCPKDWGFSNVFKSDSGFPYGIFLTSFIGVGIGIFLGGFLLFLAVNAFQRHQRRLRQMYEAPPVIPDPDYKIYDTSKMDFNLVPGFATGRHTIPRHQMSPPPIPSQPPEDEKRFSRHTYEKPKYNSTDNQPFVEI